MYHVSYLSTHAYWIAQSSCDVEMSKLKRTETSNKGHPLH
jgi:hypothetical protein